MTIISRALDNNNMPPHKIGASSPFTIITVLLLLFIVVHQHGDRSIRYLDYTNCHRIPCATVSCESASAVPTGTQPRRPISIARERTLHHLGKSKAISVTEIAKHKRAKNGRAVVNTINNSSSNNSLP